MNEVIKSFLVGLGFDVDESSLAKFNKALTSATLKVTALYATIKVAAAGIFAGIAKISEGFEEMGYEMRLIAPTLNKVLVLRQELLKAYSRAGVDIYKVVQQSVKFNMSLTKTQYALKALATGVAARFFPLLTKQMDIFRNNIYKNMPKIQQSLEKFINFIFKAFEVTSILGERVWSILSRIYDFFERLHRATNGWSTVILGVVAAWKFLNLSFLASPIGILFSLATALLALYDDFMTFREGGESLINWGSDTTKIFVGIAASIALVVAAVYAIIQAISIYRAAVVAINAVMAIFQSILLASKLAMVAFNLVAALNPIGLIVLAVTALIALLTVLIIKWDVIKKGFLDFFSGAGEKVLNFLAKIAGVGSGPNGKNGQDGDNGSDGQNGAPGRSNLGRNLQQNLQTPFGQQKGTQVPIGVNSVANNQSNQHVNQQTSINVIGSSDANSVGKAVAGEQTRVNYDMVRNMKGATR